MLTLFLMSEGDGGGGSPLGIEAQESPDLQSLASSSSQAAMESLHEHTVVMLIASIAFVYLLSAILTGLVGLLPKFRPPITIVLFLAGMSLEPVLRWMENRILLHGVQLIGNVDPFVIFFALLPMCLYESSAFVNFQMFKQVLPSSLLLAIPGVAVNVIFFSFFLRYGISRIYDWPNALMLASIVSATDPVAVIACLRTLGAPEKLSSLIDGESLLNDGSAVVFFEVFRSLVIGTYTGVGSSIVLFIQLSLGALAYGLGIGILLYIWLLTVRDYHIVQVTGTIATVFTVFFTADHFLHVSGVLAVVTFGIFMAAKGSTALQRTIQSFHHQAIELLATLSVQAIFVCGGVICSRLLLQYADTVQEWIEILLVYLVLQVSRLLVVYLSWPLITCMGLPLNWKECFIIFYGGLRGVVCLALGLVVEADPLMDKEVREHIGICVAGTVLLTLLLNGTTAEMVYTRLKIYPMSKYRQEHLSFVLNAIDVACNKKKDELKDYWLFKGTGVVEAANEALPCFSKGYLDTNGNLHIPGKSYREILNNPPSCASWHIQTHAEGTGGDEQEGGREGGDSSSFNFFKKIESRDFGVPTRGFMGEWTAGLSTIVSHVKEVAASSRREFLGGKQSSSFSSSSSSSPQSSEEGKAGDSSLRETSTGKESADGDESAVLIDKETEKLEKEAHVLHVLFSAMRHFYTSLYKHSNIGGTPCLLLCTTVDKSHAYLDAQLRELARPGGGGRLLLGGEGELEKQKKRGRGGGALRYEKNVFEYEWDCLLQSLRSKYSLWKCLNSLPCDVFDLLKSYLISIVQTLYATTEAHEFLLQSNQKELQNLLNPESLAALKEFTVSSRALMEKIKNSFPTVFSQCLIVIASHMLLNAKQAVLEEEIERGLVFPEDASKLEEALSEQRMMLERISR